ncbi:hypothetical protein AAG906_028351 [Vitis piasezkii]
MILEQGNTRSSWIPGLPHNYSCTMVPPQYGVADRSRGLEFQVLDTPTHITTASSIMKMRHTSLALCTTTLSSRD